MVPELTLNNMSRDELLHFVDRSHPEVKALATELEFMRDNLDEICRDRCDSGVQSCADKELKDQFESECG